MRAHIEAQGGTLTLSKVGIWIRRQEGYAERLRESAIPRDGALTKILRALGFKVGAGSGADTPVSFP